MNILYLKGLTLQIWIEAEFVGLPDVILEKSKEIPINIDFY